MRNHSILITGLEARLYDLLTLTGTAGYYQALITRAIRDLGIRPPDRILDLGAGTGKNAALMARYLDGGSITALDISEQMLRQLHRRAVRHPHIRPVKLSIDDALPFQGEFDKVVLFFVLHGFEQHRRMQILYNARQALKPGGTVHLFDWSSLDVTSHGPLLKLFFRYIECEMASDFINRDIPAMLSEAGFENIRTRLYVRRKIRMLEGVRGRQTPRASSAHDRVQPPRKSD